MFCPNCKGPITIQVQNIISLPGNLINKLSKKAIRKKEVQLTGTDWNNANYICNDPKCGFVYFPLGNHIKKLEKHSEIVYELYELIEAHEGNLNLTDKCLLDNLLRIAYRARGVVKSV